MKSVQKCTHLMLYIKRWYLFIDQKEYTNYKQIQKISMSYVINITLQNHTYVQKNMVTGFIHIQTRKTFTWNGYCFICDVISAAMILIVTKKPNKKFVFQIKTQ